MLQRFSITIHMRSMHFWSHSKIHSIEYLEVVLEGIANLLCWLVCPKPDIIHYILEGYIIN